MQVLNVKLGHCPFAILTPQECAAVLCLVPVSEELLEDRGLEAPYDAGDLGGLGQTVVSNQLVRV